LRRGHQRRGRLASGIGAQYAGHLELAEYFPDERDVDLVPLFSVTENERRVADYIDDPGHASAPMVNQVCCI
jgi:hypothetical protein